SARSRLRSGRRALGFRSVLSGHPPWYGPPGSSSWVQRREHRWVEYGARCRGLFKALPTEESTLTTYSTISLGGSPPSRPRLNSVGRSRFDTQPTLARTTKEPRC